MCGFEIVHIATESNYPICKHYYIYTDTIVFVSKYVYSN